MKNLTPKLRWNFDFDEEIPKLDLKLSPKKQGKDKTKIVIRKKVKNGRDTSTGLF